MSTLSDQLARLEGCWQDQNPDLVERLRPGLSSAELDAILEPFEYFVPDELREWWGWHDGIEGDSSITETLQVLSAESSVRHTLQAGVTVRDAVGPEHAVAQLSEGWPDAQLAIFSEPASTFYGADCTRPRSEALLRWYSYDGTTANEIVAHSLREPVERLCELYERRLLRWEGGSGRWSGAELFE